MVDHAREDQHGLLPPWVSAHNAMILSAANTSAGMTNGSAPNVNGNEMYQAFDDRPGTCEGCDRPDYPGMNGPSALQIVWNANLSKWLCADCRHGYCEWQGRSYPDDKTMWESRPTFMRDKASKRALDTIILGEN